MTEPLRARYGNVNRGHDILEWSGPGKLPPILLGLTDKPTGTRGPGDRWWPSVGCGPVGDWWALWWTAPDHDAQRGGMVTSEVALWPAANIGEVDDLSPKLSAMAGPSPIAVPNDGYLGAIVEALVSSGGEPPVLADLDAWPGVLAALWPRLSADDRRMFSARVVLVPPQGRESIMPPSLFVTRSDRAAQWPHERVVTGHIALAELSRGVRWFLVRRDPTIAELLDSCPALGCDMSRLSRLARAADNIDRMNATSDSAHALDALRILMAIAPSSQDGAEPKHTALRLLGAGLPTADLQLILALRNIHAHAVPGLDDLNAGVRAWVDRRAPLLSGADAERLLTELDPDRTEPWWIEAVSNGVGAALRSPQEAWAAAALRWLARPACCIALHELLPTTASTESGLLTAASHPEWTSEDPAALLFEARRRGWSRLHARVAIASLPARDAIQAQRALRIDEDPGLEMIIDLIAGEVVVHEVITNPDVRFVALVARRTARQPDLLAPVDPRAPAWRVLWEAHIKAGGEHWPPRGDKPFLSRCLLDAILDGNVPEFLLENLAADIGPFVLGHEQRAALWDSIHGRVKDSLLAAAAAAMLVEVEAGAVFSPEPPLAKAAFSRVGHARPSPNVVVALLSWNVGVTEQQMIRWLRDVTPERWGSVARRVGEEISSRGWHKAAEVLAERWASSDVTRPGAIACAGLLPRWRRWVLGLTAKEVSRETLIERIAELGAELAPDELDALWERAGGKRKNLLISGTPELRWRAAAGAAAAGAFENGPKALVDQLCNKLPYNRDLQELASVLSKKEHRG